MDLLDVLNHLADSRKNVQPLNFSPEETFHLEIPAPRWSLAEGILVATMGAIFGWSLTWWLYIVWEML